MNQIGYQAHSQYKSEEIAKNYREANYYMMKKGSIRFSLQLLLNKLRFEKSNSLAVKLRVVWFCKR